MIPRAGRASASCDGIVWRAWANAEGEAVLRKVIEVPAALQGQDLKLFLGLSMIMTTLTSTVCA
jgi:hypothetical protein